MNVFIETEKRKFEELKRSGDTTDGHIRKVEPVARDFWWHPRPRTHRMGEIQDPRPATLKVGSKARDPWTLILLGTREPKPGTLKERPGTPMIYES